jgi:quercetin dioxygenase-like cupin family protein
LNANDFRALLASEKFDEVVSVSRDANGSLPNHSHPFEAKALITAGELRIIVDGVEKTYQAGDQFHLNANIEHLEFYGPTGVTYLVGRKEASL